MIRLVKMVVIPTLVEEDGDGNLDEIQAEPISVKARDWPLFSYEQWPKMLEELNETRAKNTSD